MFTGTIAVRSAWSAAASAGLLSALVLGLSPSHAWASGLIRIDEPHDTILDLDDISVTGTINAGAITLSERRIWRVASSETFRGEVTFYRTIEESEAIVGNEVLLNGDPVGGVVLGPGEADELRAQLVRETNEPAPLAEMGKPLFVSDLLDVVRQPGEDLIIELDIVGTTTPRDTMSVLQLPLSWGEGLLATVDVELAVETTAQLKTLFSPYHPMQISRDTPYTATVTYAGRLLQPKPDIELFVSESDEPIHMDLLTYRGHDDEGGYFAALLTPDAIPGENAVAREIVVVLDISGSMMGQKLHQARQAVLSLLEGLTPEDLVTVIAFNELVQPYQRATVPATPSEIAGMSTWVQALEASGGTGLLSAMRTAFGAIGSGEDRLQYLVLLTDGEPSGGRVEAEETEQLARDRNPDQNIRVHTFGIGNEVNTALLDQLAADSNGESRYARDGANLSGLLAAFFEEIGSAVFANPTFTTYNLGYDNPEIFPRVVPHLFAGQTTLVVGRYRDGDEVEFVLKGTRGRQSEVRRYLIQTPEYTTVNGFVPRLWATRQIGDWLLELKLGADGLQLPRRAVAFAERYGVNTPYTAWVLRNDGVVEVQYRDVPTDEVGDLAIETSIAIAEVSGRTNVFPPAGVDATFVSDRTLVPLGVHHSDTGIDTEPEYTEIHFGSDLYFELIRTEGDLGIGPYLAVDEQVKFPFLGRFFRVWIANDVLGEAPPESAAIPEPVLPPDESSATLDLLGPDDEGPSTRVDVGTPPMPDVGAMPGNGFSQPDEGCCSTVSARRPVISRPGVILLLVAFVAMFVRRF